MITQGLSIPIYRGYNYGTVKTETLLGFRRANEGGYNTTESLDWLLSPENFERRSMRALPNTDKILKPTIKSRIIIYKNKNRIKKSMKEGKKSKKKNKKHKGCVIHFSKIGESKRYKRRKNVGKKKLLIPLLLGIIAAKSLLIPVALKALAIISAKGLMLGFLSTVMASVLSLKSLFDNSHHYHSRKDDSKTQVEIIQVPSKSDDEQIYYDDHYKKGDILPIYPQ